MDRLSNREKVASLLVCLFPIALCLAITIFRPYNKFSPNRDDSFKTVLAFAYSLAYNHQLDSTKTYVAERNWSFIDAWKETHKPISQDCFTEDPDDGPSGGGHDLGQHIQFTLKCSGGYYHMSVSATLKRTPQGLEIDEILQVCEENKCYK